MAAAPSVAEERICSGRIGAVHLGNIVVGTGAVLSARSVSINGNLQCRENIPAPTDRGSSARPAVHPAGPAVRRVAMAGSGVR